MLTIRGLTVRAVRVPMRRPLATAGGTLASVPLLLLDLHTHEGVTGHAYLFCYSEAMMTPMRAILEDVAVATAGAALEPLALFDVLRRRYRLGGYDGLVSSTVAGFDVAVWDAAAKSAGLSLARYLGGAPRAVPAYNSNGLGVTRPDTAAAEAEELLAEGFSAVKVRLGYSDAAADVAVIRAVRARVPSSTRIMTDYNQALTVAEAVERGRALDGEGLEWIEEPVRADDESANATVARALTTPVQLGENFIGPLAFRRALAAAACDYAMFDLQRMYGITGWLRAAALADAAAMPVSSHLFPEVSAHLLAVTPTRHWLEYVDWAAPVLAEPLAVDHGTVRAADVPGTGVGWNETAVRRALIAL
ncbi:MAG: enolase C-terminal domain-like protein [Candidatus Velthaea sp.]